MSRLRPRAAGRDDEGQACVSTLRVKRAYWKAPLPYAADRRTAPITPALAMAMVMPSGLGKAQRENFPACTPHPVHRRAYAVEPDGYARRTGLRLRKRIRMPWVLAWRWRQAGDRWPTTPAPCR